MKHLKYIFTFAIVILTTIQAIVSGLQADYLASILYSYRILKIFINFNIIPLSLTKGSHYTTKVVPTGEAI